METTKTRFEFMSEGDTLVGNLFLPEVSKPAGVVVAVGPLTSVKEQAAGTYARAMAERGYAALAFDYRYFGETSGAPRQFENPDANIEDIKYAATALLADELLANLPLFGLGVCFGAGPMVCSVAEDSRFRALPVWRVCTPTMRRTWRRWALPIKRRSIGAALPNGSGGRQAPWRPSQRSRPTAAMSPCRYGRRTATGGERVLRNPARQRAQLRERLRSPVARLQPAV
jgi:hypothetical protein